jgi:hypothetical protein
LLYGKSRYLFELLLPVVKCLGISIASLSYLGQCLGFKDFQFKRIALVQFDELSQVQNSEENGSRGSELVIIIVYFKEVV